MLAVALKINPLVWDLFIVAFKQEKSDEEIKKIALQFLPEEFH